MRSGQGGEGSFLLIDYFYPIHLLFLVYSKNYHHIQEYL